MSAPTKELNTVFQNATEVTSLDSTYRLAVIGSDGDPKKVDQSVLLKGVGDFGINLVPGSLKKLVSSYITFNIPAGIPVTLSFESYEAVIGPTPTDFLVINASTIDGNGVYLNVKANESITFISAGYPRLYTSTAWTTNKGYFHKLKIEKGYSASKWTPAPEDLIALLGGG